MQTWSNTKEGNLNSHTKTQASTTLPNSSFAITQPDHTRNHTSSNTTNKNAYDCLPDDVTQNKAAYDDDVSNNQSKAACNIYTPEAHQDTNPDIT